MKPLLAIFRKIAPPLAVHVAFVALVILGFAARSRVSPRPVLHGRIVDPAALPLASGFLVIAVIHEERLPAIASIGSRDPTDGPRLWGAKALFIAVFVHLPVLLSQTAVLASNGIPPFQHFSTPALATGIPLRCFGVARRGGGLRHPQAEAGCVGILVIVAPLP